MIANIGKLTYLLDDAKSSATVTRALVPYSGDIDVPAEVVSAGRRYAVTDILDEHLEQWITMIQITILGENMEVRANGI